MSDLFIEFRLILSRVILFWSELFVVFVSCFWISVIVLLSCWSRVVWLVIWRRRVSFRFC